MGKGKIIGLMCSLAVLVSACSPTATPLYRDYDAELTGDVLYAEIRAGLQEAGWELAADPYGEAVVSTEEKGLRDFGIYKTSARVDVVQVNGGLVRLYVHPFRKYFISGRYSKVPYLDRRMRAQIVDPLTAVFAKRGIRLVGTAIEKEEKRR